MLRRASTTISYTILVFAIYSLLFVQASLDETSQQNLSLEVVSPPQNLIPASHVANNTLKESAPQFSLAKTEPTVTVSLCPSPQATSKADISTPFISIFKFAWWTVVKIYSLIYFIIITPIFGTVSFIMNLFVYKPYTFFSNILSIFYPLYMFCGFAAFLGFTIGGTAGWFSEVIVSVLTAPSKDQNNDRFDSNTPTSNNNNNNINDEDRYYSQIELENRRRAMKMRRRAAALANLRAKNGGRLPEEFYQRVAANASLQGLFPGKGITSGTASGNISDASAYSAPAPRFGHKYSQSFVSSRAESAYGD